MPRKPPRRIVSTLDDLTSAPPESPLLGSFMIGRISQAQGKYLFTCVFPSGEIVLAELAQIFRGKAWLRRGGYVLVDRTAFEDRGNKIGGQIVNVVRNEKAWRKMDYWPKEFVYELFDADYESAEESNMG